ncbi:MAG: radical SAM family heme chaperone HemW [Anaerolineae bacterium]|nr:radical SAM family heme chaperone HemW [Chloroflexota bacterium]MBP6298032.1 radical SAM family heme chaperone HemW [Anaerolineae bacterium]
MIKHLHSLYLHIPYCTTKCTYCAFNTYTNLEGTIPAFVEALCAELATVAKSQPYTPVWSVFFGGGTPSLLSVSQFSRIFDTIRASFSVSADAEITIEANPNDLDPAYLTGLRALGINRLSLGMQSAVESELKLFARRHDHEVVQKIWPEIRRAGFDNVNLDLIYGSPNQTLESWQTTLDATVNFAPEHISLYALGLEDGTPLKEWVDTGRVETPDDDLAADMYELATDFLSSNGYQQYEISNWCKPDRECRHNLQYWRNWPYIGVGPGAHGFAGGFRYATILAPQRYIAAINALRPNTAPLPFPRTPATLDEVEVDLENEIAETLIMSLRLTQEGVHQGEFEERFGQSLSAVHGGTIEKFTKLGLLELYENRVRLTRQGRLLSNMVFRELV